MGGDASFKNPDSWSAEPDVGEGAVAIGFKSNLEQAAHCLKGDFLLAGLAAPVQKRSNGSCSNARAAGQGFIFHPALIGADGPWVDIPAGRWWGYQIYIDAFLFPALRIPDGPA